MTTKKIASKEHNSCYNLFEVDMIRTAVFAFYDKNAVIDDYIIRYIKELKQSCLRVIFVSGVRLSDYEKNKIRRYVNLIIDDPHTEYDFGSYKRGFKYIDTTLTDEIVFVNDSFYGPLFPLAPIFDRMSEKDCDFWGMSENKYGLIKIGEKYKSVKRPHLQSYFMVFKKHVINSEAFIDFINSVHEEPQKNDIIINYEIGLSEVMKDAGFRYNTYAKESGDNPVVTKWKELITRHHFPLIKCSLLRLAQNNLRSMEGWENVIKTVSDYPVELITKNLERTYEYETETANAHVFSKQLYLETLPKNLVRLINDNTVFYNVFED